MNQVEQRKGAKKFVEQWTNKGYEKGETQSFWLSLLKDVFGVKNPESLLIFEQPVYKRDEVPARRLGFIDAWIPSTRVLIEQKGSDHALDKAQKQSDGSLLTPFQQGKRYADNLTTKNRPRWIVACNFESFEIHDLDDENPNALPVTIALKDLEKEFYRLSFLLDGAAETIKAETKLSVAAGELVGKLYDGLLAQYRDKDSPEVQVSLNKLCVRIVFCLYAEDALLFKTKSQFHDYLRDVRPEDMRGALKDLFRILDTPEDERDPDEKQELLDFPYVNGGLFSDESARIPQFTQELKDLLLTEASEGFNWSEISPTIFGAVFESTLNPETRRKGGMHYTSVENIEKVIKPLFMDALNEEFAEILRGKQAAARMRKLRAFQEKLGSLKFLDPACGSGNFLTETYIQLRRLENKVILELNARKGQLDFGGELSPVKVQISQFYGIEINDFACAVAETALWIAESQMLKETEDIIGTSLEFFPLKTNTNIHEGNALRLDWSIIVSPTELSYIMGNPPFIGYAYQSKEQKDELRTVSDLIGKNVDYVVGWYFRAAAFMQGTKIKAAFVSTNSIVQGEQVEAVWRPLIEELGVVIHFAWRTFRWDSEANSKAHVHCVIVGFSLERDGERFIFDGEKVTIARNINGYLLDAPNVFVSRRARPLCSVSEMQRGSQPTDDGNLILSAEEKQALVAKYPKASQFIRPFMMGKDFIERKPRYCLWFAEAPSLKIIRECPEIRRRVEAVKQCRLSSSKAATREKAETPWLFDENRASSSVYIGLPSVSSEKRAYIPIDKLPAEVVAGNKVYMVPNATDYEFAILTSSVHMAWTRAVCGRLKSDYNYSNTIVYNNFVWPQPSDELREQIEAAAEEILQARAKHPEATLSDLYDDLTMPKDLRKAHAKNDSLVLQAYGMDKDATETEIVAHLMRLYLERAEEVERLEVVDAAIRKILGKGVDTVPEWLQELKTQALNAEITPEELLTQGKALKKQEAAKARKPVRKAG